jgi:CubicO group peptidase (beta-lactamase class C family)
MFRYLPRVFYFVAPLLVCIGLSVPASAQTNHQIFDQYINDNMAKHGVVGVSIALIENNKIEHRYVSGYANADTGIKLNPSNVFQVGSISKPVAAWAIMQLVQSGKLDLDKPVSTYLTRWQLPGSDFDASKVTLRRLLSHTAGLSLGSYPGFALEQPLPTIEASLSGDTNGAGAVFIQTEPGTRWSYSGGGYTLMQLIVEEVTGMTFSNYINDIVLTPLSMYRSSYRPDPSLLAGMAHAHGYSGTVLPNFHFTAEAAASLHSTAEDLAKFALANMQTNPVLDNSTLQLMHSPAENSAGRHGLGFSLVGDGNIVGHGGSNTGWKAMVRFVPRTGAGIVVLTNSDSGDKLTIDALCFWNTHYAIGYLDKGCQDRLDQQQELALILVVIGVGFLLASAVAIWLMRKRYLSGHYGVDLNAYRAIGKLMGILVPLIILFCWVTFWHTEVGVYLIFGSWYTRAADVMPAEFLYLSSGLVVFVISLIGLTLMREKKNGSKHQ